MAYADKDEIRQSYGYLTREPRNNIHNGTDPSIFNLNETAFAVTRVAKNGVNLTVTTDFTFEEPKEITLVVAAVAGDTFIIEYNTQLSDAQLDLAIRHAREDIRSILIKRYSQDEIDTWDATTPTTIVEIATQLGGYYAEQMVLKINKIYGSERDINRRDIMMMMNQLEDIRLRKKNVIGAEEDDTKPIIGVETIVEDIDFSALPSTDDHIDRALEDDKVDGGGGENRIL